MCRITTPCVRYDVPGATGREVVILDLYAGAGETSFSEEGTRILNLYVHFYSQVNHRKGYSRGDTKRCTCDGHVQFHSGAFLPPY